jgi:hypothetical protein
LKRVAIIQSNYIPWKGYFDIIHQVDEFILFDDVQYTRRDWRNRNLIKSPQGKKWLTIPVSVRGMHAEQNINDVTISDPAWPVDHWNVIRNLYRDAPYFSAFKDRLEALFLHSKEDHLSQVNHRFLTAILEMLAVTTKITWDTDYAPITGASTERLVNLCRAAGATHYLSGPAAKAYMEPEQFAAVGIELEYMDYAVYPEYDQLYPPFDHAVSIIDLILMCGPTAPYYIWGWRKGG